MSSEGRSGAATVWPRASSSVCTSSHAQPPYHAPCTSENPPCNDLLMRIIAGTHRGQTIHAPRGRDTRPTSDRVRENVFNIVGPVDGASVLDLYAGSGALGLEALSRGAERAVFVELDAAAARAIEQ